MVTLTCSKWIELPRSSAARSNCCMGAILDEPYVGWAKRSVPTIHLTDQNGGHAMLCPPYKSTVVLLRQILQQQIQRRLRKRLHVGLPVIAAGFQRKYFVLRPRYRHAAMPGGVAVAVAGWPR